MANETRRFASGKTINAGGGVTYFETYSAVDVQVVNDPANSPQVLVTMDSTKWTSEASNYIAPDYPAMV